MTAPCSAKAPAAGLAALALALVAHAPPALAQEPEPEREPPVVVNIAGPCQITLGDKPSRCTGVAYMAFPTTHRINFTAVTAQAGWAFSGEEDENEAGQYTLTVDSVLSPGAGRVEADGECDMRVEKDGRTVSSLECEAMTPDGDLTLKASGVIATSTDDEDGDSDDDRGQG